MAALKGIDQRTIKKYVKLLEAFGCIKILRAIFSRMYIKLIWYMISEVN